MISVISITIWRHLVQEIYIARIPSSIHAELLNSKTRSHAPAYHSMTHGALTEGETNFLAKSDKVLWYS